MGLCRWKTYRKKGGARERMDSFVNLFFFHSWHTGRIRFEPGHLFFWGRKWKGFYHADCQFPWGVERGSPSTSIWLENLRLIKITFLGEAETAV